MKILSAIILVLSLSGSLISSGQNFIGMHADEIKKVMKKEHPDFILNTTSVNKYFNYLKYENEEGTQTMLIFLDDQDLCKYFKRICDYIHLPEMTIHLNEHSKRENDTLWVFQANEHAYSQVLTKQDWFFTITTRPVITQR